MACQTCISAFLKPFRDEGFGFLGVGGPRKGKPVGSKGQRTTPFTFNEGDQP